MGKPRKTPIIKLKQKPKKPQPKMVEEHVEVASFSSVKQMLSYFEGVQPKDIKIGRLYFHGTLYFIAKLPESDKAFSERVALYEEELKAWQEWYEKNEDKILQEIQRKQDVIEAKKQAEMQKLSDIVGKNFADDLPIGKK